MEFLKREPIIFLIAGKARSGKSTVGEIIKNNYVSNNKKVVVSPITKYLKKYIEEITGEEINEVNKPRELLQNISSVVIKKELRMENFFVNRLVEDLKIYSYFFDVIVIPDVRFEKEIGIVKDNFLNVVSIGVVRENYKSDLSLDEQNDITEVSLDKYDNYDYKIINDNNYDKLYLEVINILNDIKGRGEKYE